MCCSVSANMHGADVAIGVDGVSASGEYGAVLPASVRLSRLRSAVADAGADAVCIRDTANIEWVTGFRDVFDDERAHALFVSRDSRLSAVHTDSRYITAMECEAAGSPFAIDAEPVAMSAWAASMVERIGADGGAMTEGAIRLAVEDTMSLREYRALETALPERVSLVETADIALRLRAVKDACEVEAMRRAQAVTDAAFDHILGFIAPGKTEREVQLELDDFMMRNGADSLAFSSIVASGANGASPHAIVSDKVIEPGECVVMDFGARAGGYCSDMTRTVFIGEPIGEMRRAWDTLRRANETVEAELSVGMTGRTAHELALRVLAEGGFEGRMGHGLGHGVGVEIHELPNLSPRNDKPLVEGNVVTVEPGIYIPGEFGMRLEDCGVLTASGFERFTQSTHEMVVV